MKSYTVGRNLYGSLTQNTTSGNLTLGDQLINDSIRSLCSMRDWPFLERLRTKLTTASTQFTELPYDCEQVREVSVIPTGGTTRYRPRLSPSAEHWDELNMTPFTSDIPEWYFIRNGQIGLWPTPTSTGNTIYITQKTRVIDLSIADITSSTVTSITNNATTMVLSGGLTAQMVGMWIRVTYSTTANTGDGVWYEIGSITNSTTLELVRAYGGTTIAAGTAACTISQMPLLPETFHETPIKRATSHYWAAQGESQRALIYERQYKDDIIQLEKQWSSPTTSMVIDDGRPDEIINPNLTISL